MENPAENKTCESCGVTFGCEAKLDGCWCTEIDVLPAAAEALKATFKDCLCPNCLAAMAANSGIIVKFPNGETELISRAVRVDTTNYHEGMFDFYDERGTLLRQIGMSSGIKWEA